MTTPWPDYGAISGPIVMIGFGSIGRGTLPLIERHFDFDSSRFAVIAPDDSDRALLDERGIRFVKAALTPGNYRELLTPLLTAGEGQGFCVNLSVDVSSLDVMKLCRELGVLYIDTVVEPWPGFLFRPGRRSGHPHQLCVARDGAPGEGAQPRRDHRGVLLRRQPGHGLLVRQGGAAEHRRRYRGRRRPIRAGDRAPAAKTGRG
jgi:hypothetical protein